MTFEEKARGVDVGELCKCGDSTCPTHQRIIDAMRWGADARQLEIVSFITENLHGGLRELVANSFEAKAI